VRVHKRGRNSFYPLGKYTASCEDVHRARMGHGSNGPHALNTFTDEVTMTPKRLRWSRGGLGVSRLASGTQVRGFKPGRSRRIFKGGKILSTASFGREVKPWVPYRRFAACKRSLNVPWKSTFRQNYRSYSPSISSNFRRWSAERVGRRGSIWWPKVERPKRAVQ
jgi:hypothetical protein